MRFDIYAGASLIGHSELNGADPPMGVAAGKFSPLPAYEVVRQTFVGCRDGSQAHLNLSVRTSEGDDVPAQGGVQVIDYSTELGPDGVEVHVLGIPYPLYEVLFPEAVAGYWKK